MSSPDSTYSILFDIFVLGQRVRQLLNEAMADSPLRPEEYAVYSVVFEEEAVTPTAMAEALSMPFSTVMDHLKVMEQRGHARRIANPRDGRSYLVVLSAAGMRAHKQANTYFEEVYERFVAALPRGETDTADHLAHLLAALDETIASLGLLPSKRGG